VNRVCATCRTPLVRKVFACGAIERPGQFAKRRFCDRACADMKRRPVQPHSHPWLAAGRKVADRIRGQ
jgi:hypothetical protein